MTQSPDAPGPDGPGKVLVELTIAAPADAVWAALRDPVQINRWFGWDADTLADEVQYIFVDHAVPDDAARILRFDQDMPDRFEVEDHGDHCVVRLVRAGAAGDDSDWDGVHEDMTEGWLAFLTQLHFAMERHRGEARRTIYLSGKPGDAGALPRARLGLDTLAGIARGGGYSLVIPTGETLSGRVWARSRRQVALTVDAYGDGLVVVTDRSAENSPPVGGGSVTLTTYGLDEARFGAVRDQWSRWWNTHFPPAA